MNYSRPLVLTLFAASASAALAGQLDLNPGASAGIFLGAGPTILAQNSATNTGSLTGPGSIGPITANAVATSGPESVTVTQSYSGNILSETSGSVSIVDSWNPQNAVPDQGWANVSPSSGITYSFMTAAPETLAVSFTASTTGNDFGFYNTDVTVDGVLQTNPQINALNHSTGWISPYTSGNFSLVLGAGSHTLYFHNQDNISGGTGPFYMGSLNETLTFGTSVAPVPEPASMAVLGIGVIGLLIRRRK